MNAEIIAVGTELLLGQILNTNAQYLSRQLADLGINVYYQMVIGDNEDRLRESIEIALKRADLVITTGGLGPTKDDLTKETIAKCLKLPLDLHQGSMDWIEGYFKQRQMPMTLNNIKQAYLPQGCSVVPNYNGTAPGCIIDKKEKIVIMLPGPPSELIPMFEDTIKGYLRTKSPYVIHSKELMIIGIGESKLEEMIQDILDKQSNPTIAPYAKQGQVMLRVTAKAESIKDAEQLMEPVVRELYARLKEKIYTEENKTLEEIVIELLKQKRMTLATAESCTGGMLASTLLNVAGASSVFDRGIISYSNSAKEEVLNVKRTTLEGFGAVSRETAVEMAQGALQISGADIGIGITGIAGPTGGTEEKPVGLVYVSVATKDDVDVTELRLSGARQKIRQITTLKALDLLRIFLLKKINTSK